MKDTNDTKDMKDMKDTNDTKGTKDMKDKKDTKKKQTLIYFLTSFLNYNLALLTVLLLSSINYC
jgi:hypothetical protein